MITMDDLGYTPTQAQLEFHNDTNKYKLLYSGIRSGKTTAIVIELLLYLLNNTVSVETSGENNFRLQVIKWAPEKYIEYSDDKVIRFRNGSELLLGKELFSIGGY